MKSQLDIQRAHDTLLAVITGEVPANLALHAALDALCWVLGHAHNQAFADNLAVIEEALTKAGFVLKDVS